jgi:hypothetical protein
MQAGAAETESTADTLSSLTQEQQMEIIQQRLKELEAKSALEAAVCERKQNLAKHTHILCCTCHV